MSHYTIYHNPRCRKSREALHILHAHGIDPEIREYLKHPPTPDELKHLEKLLGKDISSCIRKKEPIYKEFKPGDDTLITFVSQHPIVLERPIIIKDDKKAIIARPPELIMQFL